jgi:hypothetical protein
LNAARSSTGGSKWRKKDANNKDQKHLLGQKEIRNPKAISVYECEAKRNEQSEWFRMHEPLNTVPKSNANITPRCEPMEGGTKRETI